ncbi:acyclic terpene utilization AtuA family protein [Brevibacterium sp. FAM 24638]|uniref:acyclic terpene utilization AtuA family protein n=1 Tax=Brevibacterium sp. FAM 24638 TaxID=3415681 RepID=UPI003C7E3E92
MPSTDEFKIVAPTGTLGYGFSAEDFRNTIRSFKPDLVAVDAGSTDPGPYYLGAGKSFTSRATIKYEIGLLLEECLPNRIPVVIGNCGGAGGRPHLEWVNGIVLELAAERSWRFRLAVIDSEIDDTERVKQLVRQGHSEQFESDVELTDATIDDANRLVAQLGPEPISDAFAQEPDVVLVGRVCDDAIFSALPIAKGFDHGLASYAGKVLECGALACEPVEMDVLTATIGNDYVIFEPGAEHRRSTVKSVTGHSLYERENPFEQAGPGGVVDLHSVRITQESPRSVRVEGVRFTPKPYTLKLEGVREAGYRSACIAGITDPILINQLPQVLETVKDRTQRRIDSAGLSGRSISFRRYGVDAVPLSKWNSASQTENVREVGVVIEVIADTEEDSLSICHEVAGSLLHVDYPGQMNTAGNVAFPFSPAEFNVGQCFEFSIYHLVHVDDPREFSRLEVTEVGGAHA